jgi:hypothetical protein
MPRPGAHGTGDMATLKWGRPTPRRLVVATIVAIACCYPRFVDAAISQGDLSIFGFVETREAGRWGEGGSRDNSIPDSIQPTLPPSIKPGIPATESGGSFDFNRWDLAEARQLASIRPEYHFIKNHKLLGRFDTLFIKDASFFAYYRTWYDAEGSIKPEGRAEPFRDWSNYTQRELQDEYFRDELHEYYADLNFSDNFSMRIGKQQIVWSEASLLSGTEITNPGDVTFHGLVGAESAEDTRKGLRMVKADYLVPDFLKSTNNELEAFWIPGDFEGGNGFLKSNISIGQIEVNTDSRNPYAVPLSLSGPFSGAVSGISSSNLFNQEGQPIRVTSLLDLPQKPMVGLVGVNGLVFGDFLNKTVSRTPPDSITNSEFGARFSSLLPIGDGLQTSFIFLYEARSPRSGVCVECHPPAGYVFVAPGIFFAPGIYTFGKPRPGVPKAGTILSLVTNDYRRNPYFGWNGTYYDKDITEAVYRYDTLYAPRVGVSAPTSNHSFAKWTELGRIVMAVDRPTLIPFLYPYLTKQHSLLTLQATETFYPDLPAGAIPNDPSGKVRRWSTFLNLSCADFLADGQVANVMGVSWDADNRAGQVVSNSTWRYSRSILIGLNLDWYLGQSGRHTDPFLFSKSQRINELELTLSYEI